ncbi:MAG: DHHW family protein [Anaerotruncus massiliensis (ex Togo et al. 2019)]
MSKKLSGVVFLAAVFAVPLFLLLRGGGRPLWDAVAGESGTFAKLEQAFAERFPSSDALRRLQVSLNYMGGGKEQNGVFISGDSLTLDVQPKSLSVINDNTLAMIDFADDYQIPSYVMLIPTACAVQQGKVPYDSIAPLYNQPQLIDDVYRRVSGHVTAINVYPTLFNHQDEYIYYNTDNTTTGLGGFYIYTAVAKSSAAAARSGFSIEHIDYDYYGDLYALPYREVSPDRVSVYNYNPVPAQLHRHHYSADGTSAATTPSTRNSKRARRRDGHPARQDFPGDRHRHRQSLLHQPAADFRPLGAELPAFLLIYEQVTFVDTATATPELLQSLRLGRYNQVLFAFSVDSYVSADQLSLLSELPAPPGRQS